MGLDAYQTGPTGTAPSDGAAWRPEDRRWLWLVYATVFLPVLGLPMVGIGGSILYFRWRRRWPDAAARLNRHAWASVALNVALTLAILRG